MIDSRPAEQGAVIRRRRRCEHCDYRFTTYEKLAVAVLVRKRDGSLEPFAEEKVRTGVEAAVADRPVGERKVREVIEAVAAAVDRLGSPVPSETIGRIVLGELRRLDEVAYMRFASVYKDFQAAEDFEKEMAALESES